MNKCFIVYVVGVILGVGVGYSCARAVHAAEDHNDFRLGYKVGKTVGYYEKESELISEEQNKKKES
jgi:hypothetical protein